ncbi:MAG: guanylate kinase [Christensenellales bacterium]|jgi:guanylate kinase
MTGCDTSLLPGLLVLLSGPSGSGKGNISRLLLDRMPRLVLSVSATTRAPRENEAEGVDYFFKNEKEFLDIAKKGGFLEYKRVFGMNHYGTPRAFVEQQRAQGKDVLLEIDVTGALEVKRKVPDAVSVFVMPPSFAELERRLRGRGTEDDETVAVRMRTAYDELKSARLYDYFVVNDELEKAAGEVRAILEASRLEVRRRLDVIGAIMEGERQR